MERQLEPISTNSKRMTVTAVMRKDTNELLHVYASGDFVDFILSFLTIPLGGIASLLGSKTCFKSINNLYNSTENLINGKHLIRKKAMKRLREPELPPYYVSKNQIFPLEEQTLPLIYYNQSVTDSSNRTVEKGFWMSCKDPKGDQGCYVKPSHKGFLISNNLYIISYGIFTKARYERPHDVKEVEVQIGLKEGLSILKASLASTSALSYGLINHPMLKQERPRS